MHNNHPPGTPNTNSTFSIYRPICPSMACISITEFLWSKTHFVFFKEKRVSMSMDKHLSVTAEVLLQSHSCFHFSLIKQSCPGPLSSFSHFGSKWSVLLSNRFVVFQNPLQVSHSFVTVFRLNLTENNRKWPKDQRFFKRHTLPVVTKDKHG